MMSASLASLADLGATERAAACRDEAWGRVVTYSRKVFIPLTNLCRDTCGYCTFARHPSERAAGYLSPDDVLKIAREGERLGCKEALFSLGERPEARYPEARAALARLGYDSTLDYLVAMCGLVLEETGLIPHANPGTLSEEEMARLAPVCGSLGLMLESMSERLMKSGGPHHGCPDKHPARRLATLVTAARLNIPFTTGLLLGIGETWDERMATLEAIADVEKRYGGVQEVIVQNFRAKPGIAMAAHPEPSIDDCLRTIAAARLILPPEVSIQAPPNLMPESYGRYLDAGINDWGGVSPVTVDHINPERAWPKIAELAAVSAERGFTLKERLAVYPRFLENPDRYLAPRVKAALEVFAGSDGLPREQRVA